MSLIKSTVVIKNKFFIFLNNFNEILARHNFSSLFLNIFLYKDLETGLQHRGIAQIISDKINNFKDFLITNYSAVFKLPIISWIN